MSNLTLYRRFLVRACFEDNITIKQLWQLLIRKDAKEMFNDLVEVGYKEVIGDETEGPPADYFEEDCDLDFWDSLWQFVWDHREEIISLLLMCFAAA